MPRATLMYLALPPFDLDVPPARRPEGGRDVAGGLTGSAMGTS